MTPAEKLARDLANLNRIDSATSQTQPKKPEPAPAARGDRT